MHQASSTAPSDIVEIRLALGVYPAKLAADPRNAKETLEDPALDH